jgi:hypothetical protein
MADGAPIIHDEPEAHVRFRFPTSEEEPRRPVGCETGDFEKGMQAADFTFDDVYETPYPALPDRAYVSLAQIDSAGRIVITTSTQVPFHCRRIVAQTLGIPVQKSASSSPHRRRLWLQAGSPVGRHRGHVRPAHRPPLLLAVHSRGELPHRPHPPPLRVRIRAGIQNDGTITAIGMDCW